MEHEDWFIRFAVPVFLFANVAAVVLYFAVFFDPRATRKPGWADYLG